VQAQIHQVLASKPEVTGDATTRPACGRAAWLEALCRPIAAAEGVA